MDPKECKHLERVSALMDGELRPPERTRFHHHLADCQSCQQALESYLAMRQQIHQEVAHLTALNPDSSSATSQGWWRGSMVVPVPLLVALLLVSLLSPIAWVLERWNPADGGARVVESSLVTDLAAVDRGKRARIIKLPRRQLNLEGDPQ